MIKDIVLDKEKLNKMSEESKKLAIYDVEDRILNEIKKLISK